MNYKDAQTYFSSEQIEAMKTIIEHEIETRIRVRNDGSKIIISFLQTDGTLSKIAEVSIS